MQSIDEGQVKPMVGCVGRLCCSNALGHFNFWLSLSLSDSLSETLIWTLQSGLRPKFNFTSV